MIENAWSISAELRLLYYIHKLCPHVVKFEVETEFMHLETCLPQKCKRKWKDTKGKTFKHNLEYTKEEEDQEECTPESLEGSFAVHMVRKKCTGNSEDITVDNYTPDTNTDIAGRKYPVFAAKMYQSYLDYVNMLQKKGWW